MSARESIIDLRERMGRSIIGQEHVVERLLLTLLCNGNLLLEGLPGLATSAKRNGGHVFQASDAIRPVGRSTRRPARDDALARSDQQRLPTRATR